jgi:hypothetical protein
MLDRVNIRMATNNVAMPPLLTFAPDAHQVLGASSPMVGK